MKEQEIRQQNQLSRLSDVPLVFVGAGLVPARDNERLTPTGGGRAQGPPLRKRRRPQAPFPCPRIVGAGLVPARLSRIRFVGRTSRSGSDVAVRVRNAGRDLGAVHGRRTPHRSLARGLLDLRRGTEEDDNLAAQRLRAFHLAGREVLVGSPFEAASGRG